MRIPPAPLQPTSPRRCARDDGQALVYAARSLQLRLTARERPFRDVNVCIREARCDHRIIEIDNFGIGITAPQLVSVADLVDAPADGQQSVPVCAAGERVNARRYKKASLHRLLMPS